MFPQHWRLPFNTALTLLLCHECQASLNSALLTDKTDWQKATHRQPFHCPYESRLCVVLLAFHFLQAQKYTALNYTCCIWEDASGRVFVVVFLKRWSLGAPPPLHLIARESSGQWLIQSLGTALIMHKITNKESGSCHTASIGEAETWNGLTQLSITSC